jgi:hypothetical protein
MAKLTTIEYDDTGQAMVTYTDLPPDSAPTSPKKRVPSSPHKPFTSSNFYDLTKSDSPDISPVTAKEPKRSISSGFRALQQMDRENTIPGPFAKSNQQHSSTKPKEHQGLGFRKGTYIHG